MDKRSFFALKSPFREEHLETAQCDGAAKDECVLKYDFISNLVSRPANREIDSLRILSRGANVCYLDLEVRKGTWILTVKIWCG